MSGLTIIMVGETIPGSRTPQRRRALEELGHRVVMVATNVPGQTYETPPSLIERVRYRFRIPMDRAGANQALLVAAAEWPETDVVWVENARTIQAKALIALRQIVPRAKLVWYSEDDTMNPRHRSRYMDRTIPIYDLWVTTKSFNAWPDEVPSLGARRVLAVNNSFDPTLHAPVPLEQAERQLWGADVAFVGTYEGPRAESLLKLARAGLAVRVWGNGWKSLQGVHPLLCVEGRPVYDLDYSKVCSSSKINLAFLRKFNRDMQTCRSIEIPACGAFMLHERNVEISALFTEDYQASYFSSDQELLEQCVHWLADDQGRARVAAAGHQRVLRGMRHQDILASVLRSLRE